MSKEKKDNLFYVKIFLAIFALIFFISIFIKAYQSFTDRSFTKNTFNILIVSDKYVGVVGVDENENRLYSALVTEDLTSIKKRSIFVQSINFGIPIHAYLVYPENMEAKPPIKTFFSLGNIWKIITSMEVDKENISFFDWIRLYTIVKNAPDDMTLVKTYASINDLTALLPEEREPYFRDSEIAGRKTSLQVINGTKINGLGSRVGDMFSRTGYNVVSVVTSKAEDSIIYYSEDGALSDAQFIAKSFDFPVQKSTDHVIASLTLVIGEDSELLLEDL